MCVQPQVQACIARVHACESIHDNEVIKKDHLQEKKNNVGEKPDDTVLLTALTIPDG